jgi:hypothetical protein
MVYAYKEILIEAAPAEAELEVVFTYLFEWLVKKVQSV